jgi:hypothetical protein
MLFKEHTQDQPDQDTEELAGEEEEKYFCLACGHLVTLARWRMEKNGEHQHQCFNPAGILFHILTFHDAPGVVSAGRPSAEFSWFQGYSWRVSLCAGCRDHLGWQFSGAELPAVFFALIRDKLTTTPPA